MMIMNLVTQMPIGVEVLIAFAAGITAFIIIKKAIINPILSWAGRVNSGMDTLLGYPEVKDPGSGAVLKPPTPALALRVDTLESAMHKLIDNQEKMLSINTRLLELEMWRKEHASWSEQWVVEIQDTNTTWQKEHEAMHLLSHETAEEIKKT